MLTVSFAQLLGIFLPWIGYCALMSRAESISMLTWAYLGVALVLLTGASTWLVLSPSSQGMLQYLSWFYVVMMSAFLLWQGAWMVYPKKALYLGALSVAIVLPSLELGMYLSTQITAAMSHTLWQLIYAVCLASLCLLAVAILLSYVGHITPVLLWRVLLSTILTGFVLQILERLIQIYHWDVTYWWSMEFLYEWLPGEWIFKDLLGWPYWISDLNAGVFVLSLMVMAVLFLSSSIYTQDKTKDNANEA